jgi:hypothetical protein
VVVFLSRGIADGDDDVESVVEDVSNQDLAEMIFIVFNEVKALQLRLDEVFGAED